MRKDVMDQLRSNKELIEFVRTQPHWYRKLSRDPRDLHSAQIAALHHFEKTIPHKVQKFSNNVQMASMMMHMFSSMNSQS
ncbi:YlbE-like family protein [Cytobacillus oceanisediminis]|uniref:YlbE-like family protein n=1 Tax=Cytobacillus oceanisediminis TaxID=665099 RepID=UPI0011A3DAFB|nr:YlbE-like family protein [Cytobacillus oceanisediminis]